MNLLRVIASVDPATGGPATGVRAFTPALAALGHSTEFLTLDDGGRDYLKDLGGPVHAMGLRGRLGAAAWLRANVTRFDAVIVHGLWQFGRTVRAVTRAPGSPPYFVMPHGMLDPVLARLYPFRHLKKRLYWRWFERDVLRDARAVLFTCQEERRLAAQTFPGYQCNEAVVAYGTAGPTGEPSEWSAAWQEHCPSAAGRRYFLFLSRIHSKKGVENLLHAYGQLLRESDRPPGSFPDLVIAGPCSSETYLQALKDIAVSEGIRDTVHWPGMLAGNAKWGALRGAEAFILPSHQENFGLSVVEALACGKAVLISDRVNIWRELVEDRAALVEPPDERGTLRLLQRWLALAHDASQQDMARNASLCYENRFEVSRAAANFANHLARLARGTSSV